MKPETIFRQLREYGVPVDKARAAADASGLADVPKNAAEKVIEREARVEEKIALEVEGGVHSGGRHVRGKGYEDDMEKYSVAATLGWRLMRVQPKQLCTAATIALLRPMFPSSEAAA